jgi:hypothetical protein
MKETLSSRREPWARTTATPSTASTPWPHFYGRSAAGWDKSTALYEETLAACQRESGPDDNLTLEVDVSATIHDGAD